MEVRRATAPSRGNETLAPSRVSGGRGEAMGTAGAANGPNTNNGGVTNNLGINNNDWISTGVGELSKRRFANDPAMMRELKRYQKLMLLTLLPSITSEADHAHAHPHAHAHHQDTEGGAAFHLRGQPEGSEDPPRDKNFNEHLPRPEPTDGFAGVSQRAASRRSPQQARSAGSQGERAGKSFPSGPASAGTRLPLTVYNPLDTSPRPRHRRRSHEDASPRRRHRRKSHDEGTSRRRRSQGDDRQQEGEEEEEMSDTAGGSGGMAAGGGELDLLTLAALYLESRHRVFGQEWHHRPDTLANSRPGAPQVGATGISRPRRLTPLSPTNTAATDTDKGRGQKEARTFSAVMPTPAGLHLSVNYTHNLGLEESTYLAERARALRPRLRRLNSMDDLLPGTPGAPSRDLQKATSAPDLSDSGHVRRSFADTMSRISSLDSISPPLVTPARANTPTEARHSAAIARPQMVGGSLATYSAVDTTRSTSDSYRRASDSVVGQPVTVRRLQLPETSRTVLPPTKLPYRSPMGLPESKMMDLPITPPPTGTVEGLRKGGRIHLQPLTIRKSSE
ncbi:uncharacterized protein [Panulirus ornatus]|uniref:uncharacterized protein isoform X2 n=1 Tax=Panulirus ornatus TaxID=150431 RepID=UPI003A8780E0